MKITDFALIFLIAFLPISIVIDIEQHRQIEVTSWKQIYDETMYNASEDATLALIQQQGLNSSDQYFEGVHKSSKDIDLNLQASSDRFYETVFINFGVVDDKVGQDSLKAYLPVQMVVGYDGLYIHTWDYVYNSVAARYETREVWMPKIPYSWYDTGNNLVINFTLDEYAYIYNNTTAVKDEGKREQLATLYPTSIFSSAVDFDSLRRQNIIELIQKKLAYYTSRANYLAKTYGRGYYYNIPMIDDDTWNNTINDVSFISFLQGFPVPGTNSIYNTYGFGGTRATVKIKYIGSTYSGVMYYHKEGCSSIAIIEDTFNSKKEAAAQGYRKCPLCNP